MKKILAALSAALLLLTLCAACGQGGASSSGEKTVDLTALGDTLTALCGEGVVPIDAETAAGLYQVESSEIAYSQAAGGVSAEEVTIFQCADEDRAAEVLSLAETRLSDRHESYADYMPEEAVKLENAVVRQSGKTVVVCVCGDAAAAAQAVEEALG